jgi:hypothetical protein
MKFIEDGILWNEDYQPNTGSKALKAQTLIRNLDLVQAQVASRPETNDFAKGFMTGLLLGSQRPEEMYETVRQMVEVVGVNHLMPFQDIGDAVLGEMILCEEHGEKLDNDE